MDELSYKLTTINCNRLNQKPKRVRVLKWAKKNFKGILFFQETHITPKLIPKWNNEIGQQYVSLFFHGTSGSRGICTAIQKNLDKNVSLTEIDDNRRYVLLQLELNKETFTLLNVYALTKDKFIEQLEFIDKVESVLSKFRDSKFVLGADFNIIQDPQLDKWNPKVNEKTSKAAVALENPKINFNLQDFWRICNPKLKRFTWRHTNPLQQYWLISECLVVNVNLCRINTSFMSDHNPVNIKLSISRPVPSGKGSWKLNNSLLSDQDYIVTYYYK